MVCRAGIWLALLGFVVQMMALAVGCGESTLGRHRGIPAPLRDDFPYEIMGLPFSHYAGDSFQLSVEGFIHYVVIAGIDSPKPGQSFYLEARDRLAGLIRGKMLRLNVIGRDSHEREIAFVYVRSAESNDESAAASELDVGNEMIKLGLGWYDGNDFADADRYRLTESEARAARRGLWVEQSPIPPWEFDGSGQ